MNTNTTYGQTNVFATEVRITLPAPPLASPRTPKPAPPRPLDEPWRQSVAAKPVMPPKSPRFDAVAFTPEQMIKAVKAEQATQSFKARWHTACSRRTTLLSQAEQALATEAKVLAALDGELPCAQIARIADVTTQSAGNALDRMMRKGLVIREYRSAKGSNRQIGYYRRATQEETP